MSFLKNLLMGVIGAAFILAVGFLVTILIVFVLGLVGVVIAGLSKAIMVIVIIVAIAHFARALISGTDSFLPFQ